MLWILPFWHCCSASDQEEDDKDDDDEAEDKKIRGLMICQINMGNINMQTQSTSSAPASWTDFYFRS